MDENEKNDAVETSKEDKYVDVATAQLIIQITKMLKAGSDIKLAQGKPFTCAVCDGSPSFTARLVGGYDTILCNRHANKWHVFVMESIEKMTYENVRVRREMAVRQGNETAALGLIKGENQASLALFYLARAWVSGQREKHAMEYTTE